jgi:hypothetical protein
MMDMKYHRKFENRLTYGYATRHYTFLKKFHYILNAIIDSQIYCDLQASQEKY